MIFKLLQKLLTKNRTEIPLVILLFNYGKYKQMGKELTCTARLHPTIANDEFVMSQIQIISDHVRDNYNMKEM